ncbi:adenylyltransferase/cytidyltransferase family protein [Candidatus Woesearchaeota archaeon]|nr:adenylyltransferase/cytidyltransferase family protein [Candidatus Woesearchaeota archaeon]
MENHKKKVLVFGTFDRIHPGHRYFLAKAASCGDSLTVVVARDITVKEVKGAFPGHNEQKRLEAVSSLPEVDKAVLGNLKDKYKVIEAEQPDIICLGYDQKVFADNLAQELEKRGIDAEIYRIGALEPERYKSSRLRS